MKQLKALDVLVFEISHYPPVIQMNHRLAHVRQPPNGIAPGRLRASAKSLGSKHYQAKLPCQNAAYAEHIHREIEKRDH
ncbi:hypothetical protein ACWJKU_05400 [Methylocaldum sp. MU1018]|jgi:hypothetical protein